uniref:L1 transposable element RRM domain-containing protein n=1 Tax=Oryzias latipes TaxID=8090 RepID=A0A3P9LQ10_ORYLA
MSLREIWAKTAENKRVLRQKPRKTQTEAEEQGLNNMAESDIEHLVMKISDRLYAKLSASMDTKLDQIVKSVSAVCENVKVLERRMENVEQRISDTEDSATQLLARLEGAETRLNEALARLEDQENRSRRNNIEIINLPERTEGDNTKEFFETWIPKVLNMKVKKDRIKVDRCHRSPGQLRPDATRPRAVYVRLHHYEDKQLIMQSARNRGEISLGGSRIHLFEDFSPALEKERRDFTEVKKTLRSLGIPYRMLFPAVLRVNHKEKVHVFKKPPPQQRGGVFHHILLLTKITRKGWKKS